MSSMYLVRKTACWKLNIAIATTTRSMKKMLGNPVDEIKVGDKKEIRIRKSIPEKIIITTMRTAICTIIAFTLCFIASLGVLVAVAWLADLDEEIRERRF